MKESYNYWRTKMTEEPMIFTLKDSNDEVMVEFPINKSGINDAGQNYNFLFYPNENIRIKVERFNEDE